MNVQDGPGEVAELFSAYRAAPSARKWANRTCFAVENRLVADKIAERFADADCSGVSRCKVGRENGR